MKVEEKEKTFTKGVENSFEECKESHGFNPNHSDDNDIINNFRSIGLI